MIDQSEFERCEREDIVLSSNESMIDFQVQNEKKQASPKLKIVLAIILVLFLAIVEGVICVQIFKPKEQTSTKDKKLVAMLNQYVDLVENGADKKALEIFHFGYWDSYDGETLFHNSLAMDANILYRAMDKENEGVEDLSYKIIGVREDTGEPMIAAVDFTFTRNEKKVTVRKDIPVMRGDTYYMEEWFSLVEPEVEEELIDETLDMLQNAVLWDYPDLYLSYCAYSEESQDWWSRQIDYQVEQIDNMSLVVEKTKNYGPVKSCLDYMSEQTICESYVHYYIDVSYDSVKSMTIEGSTKILFQCEEDSYKLFDMPKWISNPPDARR